MLVKSPARVIPAAWSRDSDGLHCRHWEAAGHAMLMIGRARWRGMSRASSSLSSIRVMHPSERQAGRAADLVVCGVILVGAGGAASAVWRAYSQDGAGETGGAERWGADRPYGARSGGALAGGGG